MEVDSQPSNVLAQGILDVVQKTVDEESDFRETIRPILRRMDQSHRQIIAVLSKTHSSSNKEGKSEWNFHYVLQLIAKDISRT